MTDLFVIPDIVQESAASLARIGGWTEEAVAAAAPATTAVVAPAADSVSAAVSAMFSQHAQQFQAVAAQAANFQARFVATMESAYQAYAAAEGVAVQTLRDVVTAAEQPFVPILGQMGLLRPELNVPFQPYVPTGGPVSQIVMGATTIPYPPASYLQALQPIFPTGSIPNPLWTPQQLWPLTPDLGGLTIGQSLKAGVANLHTAITGEMAAGNKAVVFGSSQGSMVATQEIRNLMAAGSPYVDSLSFILGGNPNNPNGGLAERFVGAYLPIVDMLFNGATPPDSPYHTAIYTNQYDPVADFPRYPLNPFATLNSIMAFFEGQHNYLNIPDLTYHAMATSPDYVGNTTYYKSFIQNLPLLGPLRDIPFIGNPLAELIQPDMRVLVDLGYGTGEYANIPTPASLIGIPNPAAVLPALGNGTIQGGQAFLHELGFPITPTGGYPYNPAIDPGLNFNLGQSQVTGLSILSGLEGQIAKFIFPN